MIEKGFYWSPKCRDCFHCKQKKFSKWEDLATWLRQGYCEPRITWDEAFEKRGSLTMYWCDKMREVKPKINPPGVGNKLIPGAFCQYIDI